MSTPVAILFARRDSIYKTLPDCDVWDEDRDARNWPGGCVVVAHPPCRAWGRLKHMAKPAPHEKDLALLSINLVRQFGGVVEHPSDSELWRELGLSDGWEDAWGFCWPLSQKWFGHRAEKRTRVYIAGCARGDLPPFPITLGKAPMVVGTSGRRNNGTRSKLNPEIPKSEREHTPIEFAKWLVEVARRCKL